MQKLKDQGVDLSNQVEEISLTDLRGNVGEAMSQCSLGKSFVLKKNGKLVAALVPVDQSNLTKTIDGDGSISYGTA
jgi:antitoxin (DNA-binding transcriptional repressor) of toxin-antitoxin stability system